MLVIVIAVVMVMQDQAAGTGELVCFAHLGGAWKSCGRGGLGGAA